MKINNKIIKSSMLLLLCLLTTFSHAELSDFIHNDPWQLLNDKFIIAPRIKASRAVPTIIKSTMGLGITLGTGIGAIKFHNSYLDLSNYDAPSNYSDFHETLSRLSYPAIWPVSILIGCFAYYQVHKALVSSYQQDQLIDLLKNWTDYRSRMPSDLQTAFDGIHKEYIAYPNDFTYKTANIIRVITEKINEHFNDKTYRKFWNTKILTGNIIFDIGNTLASCAKMLGK